MLKLVKQELRKLLPLLVLSFVLMCIGALAVGYLEYQKAEQLRPDYSIREMEQSISNLEKQIATPGLDAKEKDLLVRWLADIRQKYAELGEGLATNQVGQQALEQKVSGLENLSQKDALFGNTYRQLQVYRRLLQNGMTEESGWTMNAGLLLLVIGSALPLLLLFPALLLGPQLAFAHREQHTTPLGAGISKVVTLVFGLLLLVIAVLLAVWVVGGLLFGGGGLNYPVAVNSLFGAGINAFAVLARWQVLLVLMGYGLAVSLVFALMAAAAGLALGNWLLAAPLVGGTLLASQQLHYWAINPLTLLSATSIWLVESSRGDLANRLVLLAGWGMLSAVTVVILYPLRASKVSLPKRNLSVEYVTKIFRSVRWRIILLFFFSVGLAVAGVFIVWGSAMAIYRLGLFHDLLRHLYTLAGLPTTIGFGVALFVIFFFILTGRITVYLEEISGAVRLIAGGDLSVQIPKRFNDELGELAENINSMANQWTRSKEEERRAEQTKTELITSISHDLRTPLTSVLGYLELIGQSEPEGNGELQRYAQIARQKALRLQKLIDGLFEYTRLAYGGLEVHLQPISLNSLLRQLSEEFVPSLQQANMIQVLQMPDERLQVNADGDQLVRVFDNLYANAVRYGQSAGRMTVILSSRQHLAEVCIVNYGPPIPAEDLPRIFERFYRVDKSRNEHGGGAGLGLAIAKQIVELHGGTIAATSNSEKTEFIVRLPLINTEEKP